VVKGTVTCWSTDKFRVLKNCAQYRRRSESLRQNEEDLIRRPCHQKVTILAGVGSAWSLLTHKNLPRPFRFPPLQKGGQRRVASATLHSLGPGTERLQLGIFRLGLPGPCTVIQILVRPIERLKLGEAVAIGILTDLHTTCPEPFVGFSFTLKQRIGESGKRIN